jgi:hypothetical protein
MTLDQEGIDRLVVSQASDESSWEAPVRVKRSKPAASIPPRRTGGARSVPGQAASRTRHGQVG